MLSRGERSSAIKPLTVKFRTKKHSESKIVSEYDQEIPQSQTKDKPMASRGRATQPLRDTRKTN